jgi:anthranilate/para-aminobenzoate synthase component II
MAIEHLEHPVFGVQFHPESILTQHGYAILSNFLTQAGLKSASIPPSDLS